MVWSSLDKTEKMAAKGAEITEFVLLYEFRSIAVIAIDVNWYWGKIEAYACVHVACDMPYENWYENWFVLQVRKLKSR